MGYCMGGGDCAFQAGGWVGTNHQQVIGGRETITKLDEINNWDGRCQDNVRVTGGKAKRGATSFPASAYGAAREN